MLAATSLSLFTSLLVLVSLPSTVKSLPVEPYSEVATEDIDNLSSFSPIDIDVQDGGKPPAYNNFAMNCMDDRKITFKCLGSPYLYYCDSGGNLQQQDNGKADPKAWECDYCTCVNLLPKSPCLIGLSGQVYC